MFTLILPQLRTFTTVRIIVFIIVITMLFTDDLKSFSFLSEFQVSGEFLDRLLASKDQDVYTSVLFYSSWCPFSKSFLPVFEVLKYMYPQIEHVAVEQSSAVPR